jgi:nucleoside-diphosphate-sugar epimerase
VYELAKLILSAQYIPIVGEGKARWNNVHVANLAKVYLLLCEAAVSKRLDANIWGGDVYYLVENGEHLWSETAAQIGREAEKKGYAKNLEKKTLSREAALDQAGFEAVSWGMNSRGKALRAEKVLGWKPTAPSLEKSVPEIVEDEYQRLQKAKK